MATATATTTTDHTHEGTPGPLRPGVFSCVGDTIEHPLTGERLTFLETAATTGGASLKADIAMAPGGTLPRPHTHPRGEERFEVARGRVQIEMAGRRRIAEAGETVIVPRGVGHVRGNPFDERTAVVVTLSPAFDIMTFFEPWFGLARDVKVSPRTQMPNSLQLVSIAHAYRDGIGTPGVSGLALRGLAAVLSPLAHARGTCRAIRPTA
ncbi:cupin domain-containing protein [Mycolicibacterium chubuense NBB4]|uniref:Cupin domain-containing protein n=1 Tax=Mycolicibacterium chubuense (strain NBB4) TaxID=710421 RepID=I4BF50_MYCCN|nr:cupin domain-containing protein [Mycolicibacterium chubuense]AFM15907.1 cupin domain-containing protein [Mycolicibacterium chubuense NBB4]